MHLDRTNPENELIIAHYRTRNSQAQPLAPPESNTYACINLGSHPDIVERIWDGLNPHLPVDCRAIAYGMPAVVHPAAGVVLPMAYGTRYVLRVPDEAVAVALELGCTVQQTWSGGARTNIAAQFGHGWLFGNWRKEEAQWLVTTFNRVADVYCRD